MAERFTFTPMTTADVQEIQSWRYYGQYATYNFASADPADVAEFLEPRSPYYAVRDEQGKLFGFFNFGTSALVWDSAEPSIYVEDRIIAIGLGMRPDLTGRGLGLTFVQAGLDFAREQFSPSGFRLYVYTWNKRAIRVYERAGFQHVRIFTRRNIYGEGEFLEMSRTA